MKLLKDIWAHLKEWNDWGMRDWIKAGIVAIIVLIVLKAVILPGAQGSSNRRILKWQQIGVKLDK